LGFSFAVLIAQQELENRILKMKVGGINIKNSYTSASNLKFRKAHIAMTVESLCYFARIQNQDLLTF